MAAIISFFIIVSVSFIMLRIATVILTLTGLSYDIARFQALSAFTGTGFTTRESEVVVNHPVRRRVIMMIMMVRNVGFVTVISSLVISFLDISTAEDFLLKIGSLIGGSLGLFLLSRIKIFNTFLSFLVKLAMSRWTKIHAHDYDSLLNLSSEYEVVTCLVRENNWLGGKSLQELQLSDEGLLVLGITREDGYYVGTPQGSTVIFSGDRLILYGREELLRKIGERPAGAEGDMAHLEEVKRQQVFTGKKIDSAQSKPGIFRSFFKKITSKSK